MSLPPHLLISFGALEETSEAAAQTALKARVQLLRSQLDPDFLFNTLNSLSGLIQSGRHIDADYLIASLARYLRAPSAADGPSFITMEREVGIARAFLEIHALRMDRLSSLSVVCAPDVASVQIPCLILLPLVNAAALAARETMAACDVISLSIRSVGPEVLVELVQRFERFTEAGALAFQTGISPLSTRLALLYGSTDRLEVDLGADSVVARLRLPTE